MRPLLAKGNKYSSKTTNLLRICSNVECVMPVLPFKRVGLPVAIIFYAEISDRFHFLRVLRVLK